MFPLLRAVNVEGSQELLAFLLHRFGVLCQDRPENIRAQRGQSFRLPERADQSLPQLAVARVLEGAHYSNELQRSGGFERIGQEQELLAREFSLFERAGGGGPD